MKSDAKNNALQDGLLRIVEGHPLSETQMTAVITQIMLEQAAPPEQIAAFLAIMRIKGITQDEIQGAAKAIRSFASPVKLACHNAIDIVGTGGDGAGLFNVSTAAALVCAAFGVTVAKYGNYSFSSTSGSADVLKAAGINIFLTPEQVQACIEQVGIGFMLMQQHHARGKHLGRIRKLLGFRTFMNLMGPLTNPAHVKRHVIGVYQRHLCKTVAHVLAQMGSVHVMVVYSDDGLDEISPAAPTWVTEYHQGTLKEYVIRPEDFGCEYPDLALLKIKDAEDSWALICEALSGGGDTRSKRACKAADMIALNAGAGIYVAGQVDSFEEGVACARNVIQKGTTRLVLHKWIEYSKRIS